MSYIYVLDNNQDYSDHVTLVFEHEVDFLDDLQVLVADGPGDRNWTWSVEWCAEARVLLRPEPCSDPLWFIGTLLRHEDEDRLTFACSLPRLGPLVVEWKRQRDEEIARKNAELVERLAANHAAIVCASCGGMFAFPPGSNIGTCTCGATCEVSPSRLI